MARRPARKLISALVTSLLGMGCVAGVWLATPLLRLFVLLAAAWLGTLFVVQALRHLRLARALAAGSVPGTQAGVELRWRPFRLGAAVAGLHRPTIYCDPELRRALIPSELRAVVLHERHHQLRRDPLRLLVLTVLDPVLKSLPEGRAWLERRRARLEVEADRYALHHGASRGQLASSILKLAGGPEAAPAAGFTSAVEIRLRALVEDDYGAAGRSSNSWRPRALLVFGGAAALCELALVHHWLTSSGGLGCALVGC